MTLDDLGITPQSVKPKLAYFLRPKSVLNPQRQVIGEEVPEDIDIGPMSLLKSLIAMLVIWMGMKLYKNAVKRYTMPRYPRAYLTRKITK